MIITVYVYIKKVSYLPSQLDIFIFTFTVKSFHIYGALLHSAFYLSDLITFSHLGVRQSCYKAHLCDLNQWFRRCRRLKVFLT